jgi:citrate lyase subunit beta/citryl-CoA lyase
MLAKAATLPADQVFIDLEDAVAPFAKNDATREQVARALAEQQWVARTKAVRINGVDTEWWLPDLVQVVSRAREALDCVVVPKVEDASHIHAIHHVLVQLERTLGLSNRIGIEAQIESPRGLLEIERIAVASDRIETLIFGPGDFAASAGMPQLSVGAIDESYPGDQWHYVTSKIALTAHAFGLQAIDGPYAQIRDMEGFAKVAGRSRSLGFDGKWAIHPEQIDACNKLFSPSQSEYDRAERILDAYATSTENDRVGAVVFEGEMIDEASRKMAERVATRGRAAGHDRP